MIESNESNESNESSESGELAKAYRLATDACPLQSDGCPDAAELAAAARGELPSERREVLLAILATCARCAAATQMAGDFSNGSIDAITARHSPSPRWRTPRWLPLAAAAAVVIAILPGLGLFDGQRVTRGGDPSVQPVSGAMLSTAPSELRWQTPAGVTCRVVLRDASANLLLRSGSVQAGQLSLDNAVQQRLQAGEFLWTAECGDRVLGPYAFSVRP